MDEIYLVHKREKSSQFKTRVHQLGFYFWETCLRQIAFSNSPFQASFSHSHLSDLSYYHGKEAYRFLLEIICGLHSPIIAETEVFGQFKLWVQSFNGPYSNSSSQLNSSSHLWKQLITDAKFIRHKYLNGVGIHSYGSLLRQSLKQKSAQFSSVEIIGSGFLVEKILPWFKDFKITIYCRNLNRGLLLKEKFFQQSILIKSLPFKILNKSSLIIIAAPIPSQVLKSWFLNQETNLIYDLRAQSLKKLKTSNLEKFSSIKIKTLESLLKEGQQKKKEIQPKIKIAFDVIHEKAKNFNKKIKIRPFGWDDICY